MMFAGPGLDTTVCFRRKAQKPSLRSPQDLGEECFWECLPKHPIQRAEDDVLRAQWEFDRDPSPASPTWKKHVLV